MEEFPVRKYKQVKRKEVVFDLNEWAEVERRAAAEKRKGQRKGNPLYPVV